MKVKIISLFPEVVESALSVGVIGKALKKGLWSLESINLKNYGPHIDDRPCGGGAGMIIKIEILEQVLQNSKNIFFTSPRGRILDQQYAMSLKNLDEITILCGRYEGIDQRAIEYYNLQEISIGKYILCGGESAACVILESILRLLPNVLNNEESIENESYTNLLLEHDHYALPRVWKNLSIPDILFSGNHKDIEHFRYLNALEYTYKNKEQWYLYRIFFTGCVMFYLCFGNKKRISKIKNYIKNYNK